MRSTFSEYRIPPDFFGPLQAVDYDGISGNQTANLEDTEFKIEDRKGVA